MGLVLVVDDVEGKARLLVSLLTADGHVMRTAAGGAEAVRMVLNDHPDLVLIDVMRPEFPAPEL